MFIFIICTVRNASNDYRLKLENYVNLLEKNGHIVHLPHRDTNQSASGIDICTGNMNAIKQADEVHIFYNPESLGTHFDMGVAFANNKKIKIVENVTYGSKKSFARFLSEWEIRGI